MELRLVLHKCLLKLVMECLHSGRSTCGPNTNEANKLPCSLVGPLLFLLMRSSPFVVCEERWWSGKAVQGSGQPQGAGLLEGKTLT